MRMLVACERSGRVRDAFLKLDWDAYSCDIAHDIKNSNRHIRCDARLLLKEKWDLIIAHPPCTYLCNSGVCHLHKDSGRWGQLELGASFFNECLNGNAEFVCVENPIPHKYAKKLMHRGYSQIIHPWQFGHDDSKSTCLWLKRLPDLKPTNILDRRYVKQRNHWIGPGPYRQFLRSLTYQGIANAMASQWTEWITACRYG